MATRNRQGRASLEARIAALETEMADLRRRLGRLEGGEVRILRAAPFDGRGRARPTPGGPRCPGCRLVVAAPSARCPWCSLPFAVLPPRLRPAFGPARGASRPQARPVRGRKAAERA